jgi:Family of unknown function (DUF6184)
MLKHRMAWLVSTIALAGCMQEGAAAPSVVPDTAPGGSPEAREHAVAGVLDRIVKASCDREQSCSTIGPGATFGSLQECQNTFHAKYAKELSVGNCPGGIDDGGLKDCLTSLDAGQCSGPEDSITRSATCSTKSICIK